MGPNIMKKYIKPEAISYSPDTEAALLAASPSLPVVNEEGNGIQRSKAFFGLEDDTANPQSPLETEGLGE